MLLAAIDQRAVISVAFAEIEFAADNVVARCRIAMNVDALDVKTLSRLNHISEVDDTAPPFPSMGGGIPLTVGHDIDERFAGLGERDRQIADSLVYRISVIDPARRSTQ